jgi:hypothetical protein
VEILFESFVKNIYERYDDDYDIWEAWEELINDVKAETFYQFKNRRKLKLPEQPLDVIPFYKLKAVWNSYVKYGEVKNIKWLEDIVAMMKRNTAKLRVNTEFCGHTTYNPDDELTENGLRTEKQKEAFWDWLGTISDYGLEPLEKLVYRLYKADKPEDQLLIVDMMLNVVHQTSDLAKIFVEGGSRSLSQLAEGGRDEWITCHTDIDSLFQKTT